MTDRVTVGAVYCLYEDWRWLEYSIKSIYSVVDKIFFLVSSRPWHKQDSYTQANNEKTLSVIQSFNDKDNKFVLIQSDWEPPETNKRNFGLDLIRKAGLDYCLIIDADEVYETDQLRTVIQIAELNPQLDVFRCHMYTYWKSEHFRIDPPEQYSPCILVKTTDNILFYENRDVSGKLVGIIPPECCIMHHFSYARTDEELLRKHIFVPGHSQSAIPNWYENVWKAWDNDHHMINLHPVWPQVYQKAIPISMSELPKVFLEYENSDSIRIK